MAKKHIKTITILLFAIVVISILVVFWNFTEKEVAKPKEGEIGFELSQGVNDLYFIEYAQLSTDGGRYTLRPHNKYISYELTICERGADAPSVSCSEYVRGNYTLDLDAGCYLFTTISKVRQYCILASSSEERIENEHICPDGASTAGTMHTGISTALSACVRDTYPNIARLPRQLSTNSRHVGNYTHVNSALVDLSIHDVVVIFAPVNDRGEFEMKSIGAPEEITISLKKPPQRIHFGEKRVSILVGMVETDGQYAIREYVQGHKFNLPFSVIIWKHHE